jgi:hypothetical protein
MWKREEVEGDRQEGRGDRRGRRGVVEDCMERAEVSEVIRRSLKEASADS